MRGDVCLCLSLLGGQRIVAGGGKKHVHVRGIRTGAAQIFFTIITLYDKRISWAW